MKYRCFLTGILIFAFLLCGCAGKEEGVEKAETKSLPETAAVSAPAAGTSEEDISEEKVVLAAFTCIDLDGNAVTEDLFSHAELTMVNVWATYCGPCLNEMPGLGKLAGEYEPEDFQMIGIISDVTEDAGTEDREYVNRLIQETGADYPHLLLNESLYHALLTEVSVVPTTFFFDGDGQLVDTVIGAQSEADWRKTIDGLLEK